MRSMLLRSEAGGVAGVVEVGASGGGSADAARAGGDLRAGDELNERARGATCSNADPRPGSAYGANLCAFVNEGAVAVGGTGGGGNEYCCSNGCKLNSSPGVI